MAISEGARSRSWFSWLPTLRLRAKILLGFALVPILNHCLCEPGHNKDYDIWYDTGQRVMHGGELYFNPQRAHFEFLYPPPAAIPASARRGLPTS